MKSKLFLIAVALMVNGAHAQSQAELSVQLAIYSSKGTILLPVTKSCQQKVDKDGKVLIEC